MTMTITTVNDVPAIWCWGGRPCAVIGTFRRLTIRSWKSNLSRQGTVKNSTRLLFLDDKLPRHGSVDSVKFAAEATRLQSDDELGFYSQVAKLVQDGWTVHDARTRVRCSRNEANDVVVNGRPIDGPTL
jgi:hypothetical protein